MKYIELNDLISLMKQNVINDLSENNYPLLDQLEKYAYSQIDAFIGFKFDTDAALKGKNQFLVMTLVDLISYHLSSRITHVEMQTIIDDRYNTALNWLKDVSVGKIVPNLPMNEPPEEFRSENYYSTDSRINSQW